MTFDAQTFDTLIVDWRSRTSPRTRTVRSGLSLISINQQNRAKPKKKPLQVGQGTLEERFLSRTEERPCPVPGLEGPCLLWTSNVDKDGYGRFYVSELKKVVRSHRWSYENWMRPLDAGEVPDHLCRVRKCVSPKHLEAVTHGENSRRGRSLQGREKCSNGHDWKEHGRVDTSGNGVCLACNSERVARWRKANPRTADQKAQHAARERERRQTQKASG